MILRTSNEFIEKKADNFPTKNRQQTSKFPKVTIKQLDIYSIPYIYELWDTFEKDKVFAKANEFGYSILKKVENNYLYLGIPALILSVNFAAFSVKKSKKMAKNNSILYISGRGSGKSQMLKRFIAKNNPKAVQLLPGKIHESALVKLEKSYYDRKVLIREDMITTFTGMDTKQREQLVNFFNEMLEGHYSRLIGREEHKIEVDTCILAGVAEESFNSFKGALFESTFFERMIPFRWTLTGKQKQEVLAFVTEKELNGEEIDVPDIKLPYFKKPKDIKNNLNREQRELIDVLSYELDYFGVVTSNRANQFIQLFMMGNALLNGRKEVSNEDLKMYKLVHPFFKDSLGGVTNEGKVLKAYRWKIEKKKSNKQCMAAFSISRGTWYRYVGLLREKGMI